MARIAGLKAIRDQAQADAERAQAMLENSGQKRRSRPQMVRKFARTAKKRMRTEDGGYRRDHLRALAQRVEVAENPEDDARRDGLTPRLLPSRPAASSAAPAPGRHASRRGGGAAHSAAPR